MERNQNSMVSEQKNGFPKVEILRGGNRSLPDCEINKAGIVPVRRNAGRVLELLVMQPVARHAHLGAPKFQICKGTRMVHVPGAPPGDATLAALADPATAPYAETLAATALREGEEEIGLKAGNIARLWDAGAFCFTSASTGLAKWLRLFVAALHDTGDFAPPSTTLAATESIEWMTVEDFMARGRSDHRPIIEALPELLKDEM